MLTPSQRRCEDAQNPPAIPVEEASQSVVQSHRKLVGPTLPNTDTSPCGARDGADARCTRFCWCCECRSRPGNDQLQRCSNLYADTVQTFAEYAGAVICLIGLIFAGVSFMSGNIQRGVIVT
jgi:hypothetical protein